MNDNLKMVIWAVVIIVAVFFITNAQKADQLGFVGSNNIFVAVDDTDDHKSVTVTTTAYAIAKNPSRQYARFSVDLYYSTSSVWIWQNTSTDSVVINKGIQLCTSTSYYEIDSTNLYQGEIQLISEGWAKVSWIEQP